jgi:hypothetical protein
VDVVFASKGKMDTLPNGTSDSPIEYGSIRRSVEL